MENERVYLRENEKATKKIREEFSKLPKDEIIERYLDLKEQMIDREFETMGYDN